MNRVIEDDKNKAIVTAFMKIVTFKTSRVTFQNDAEVTHLLDLICVQLTKSEGEGFNVIRQYQKLL